MGGEGAGREVRHLEPLPRAHPHHWLDAPAPPPRCCLKRLKTERVSCTFGISEVLVMTRSLAAISYSCYSQRHAHNLYWYVINYFIQSVLTYSPVSEETKGDRAVKFVPLPYYIPACISIWQITPWEWKCDESSQWKWPKFSISAARPPKLKLNEAYDFIWNEIQVVLFKAGIYNFFLSNRTFVVIATFDCLKGKCGSAKYDLITN